MIFALLAIFSAVLCATSLAILSLRLSERLHLSHRMGKPVAHLILPEGVRRRIQPLIDKLRRRRDRPLIARQFPFVIDMLCLSLDAGLDFVSAIARVADQMSGHPLGRILHRFLADIRLGRPRAEALRRLRDEICLPMATRLTALLIQADMLGAPIAALLREEAHTLRFDRFQNAERLGQSAAQKLLFPLVFCIMPVVFLVIFGPIFVQISQSGLDGFMGGGS